ncbi:MAG: DUF1127 domain-containing protein [Geminicoccaceae bacterium]
MNALDHNLHLGTRHGSWPPALDGRFGRPSLGLAALLGSRLRWVIEIFELWARRARDRDALVHLDDHVLEDIGLTRAQAEAEWRKPVWRA